MTDEEVPQGLIVPSALEWSVQEKVRLAALGALDTPSVDVRLRKKTCRALLLRLDESRRVWRQATFHLSSIYRDAGKDLPQGLRDPDLEAHAIDPKPYVARWRKLPTETP